MELADKDFHHPYTPYEIQLQFMKALYTCIEQGKIGIFESPTGTGKSLSLICGSLTWLRDHKCGQFLNTAEDGDLDDEPQWMLEHTQRQRKKDAAEKIKDLESRLAKIRKEEERQRRRFEEHGHLNKKRKLNTGGSHEEKEPESFFELDDYESDVETGSSKPAPKGDDNLSSDTLALLEKLRGGVTNIPDAEQERGVQIFYCSRTHSQLTQFAHELRRVKLPPSVPIEVECESGTEQNKREKTLEEGMKHVSLGSRKNLCVNPKVQALNNATAINERCLDLQKPGVSSDHKCPYLPNKDNEVLVNDFRDHTLAKVRDIEDIGKIGSKLGICPYYASRSVIKDSEIVTLPYPLLLQRSAREALNISLKNHVIIIDEAHNLMDTISNIHSVTLSLTQLNTALSQLTIYARKYKSRLKGKNRVYVTQVIRLVSSIADYLKRLQATKQPTEGSIIFSDIMKGNNVDQINPHKLSRYLHESKLARKIDGYIEFSKTTNNEGQSAARQSVPILFQVQSFLLALMNPSAEGRLFFEKLGNNIILKYMLLDPTNHFREIAEDARAVILAGGTMSPMGDYADQLFSYLEPGRLQTFSYGHVIPRDNLIVTPVMNATSTTSFDFTYEKRNSESMILDLGKTVMDICRVTPDGVVAFFPSYDYLNHVLAVWRKRPSTAQASTFRSMELIKTVLHESQDKATNTDNLLQNYSDAIKEGKGALLLAVMGGKLSEGINFSNELGRGVIVVGLPFPNARSAVWQTKIEHVERRAYGSCIGTEDTKKAKSKAAGREFYENSCMRTVNQCIGRAIRHQNDYAAIILMDRRYSTPRIQSKLPGWIRQSIVPGVAESFSERGIKDLSAFFHEKRSIDPTKIK